MIISRMLKSINANNDNTFSVSYIQLFRGPTQTSLTGLRSSKIHNAHNAHTLAQPTIDITNYVEHHVNIDSTRTK